MKITKRTNVFTLMMFVMFLLLPFQARANIELNDINFDPAIIAAGDTVDVVIQYKVRPSAVDIDNDLVNNPDYSFRVKLLPDDSLTRDYVIFEDDEGDGVQGTVYSGQNYNKRFRVRLKSDAPSGTYRFKLEGRWYHDGEPMEGIQSITFDMPVKKEGIIIDVASMNTIPSAVRPGDEYVEITNFIENVGEKDAKSVEVNLELPEGLEASYTDSNRKWAGYVASGQSKQTSFFVNLDEGIEAKEYVLRYNLDYMDTDNNRYDKTIEIPFLVKPRPYLEIVEASGEGNAGEDGRLEVKIKNTGTESAEAVDVRILKQNSQPFTIDVRSDYIGELEPGEEGLAVFEFGVQRDATLKEHNLKLLIRSKGDSDEGDENIYTYNRRATFDVTGQASNTMAAFGLGGAAVVLGVLGVRGITRKKKRR